MKYKVGDKVITNGKGGYKSGFKGTIKNIEDDEYKVVFDVQLYNEFRVNEEHIDLIIKKLTSYQKFIREYMKV